MSKVIGIDLGTSESVVSVFEAGQTVVIANSEGDRTTPSVVSFGDDGERKIGKPAKRQAITNPKKTVYEIKRFIGNKYNECSQEINRVTYEVVNESGLPKVKINDRNFTPEEISSIILQKMKKTAEEYLGEKVDKCVVTVPAYFNDSQRQATKDAATIAGMECLRIINEPTAAAIAYGIDKVDKEQNICVFDFGGGTHDVSILNFGNGVFEVLATDGDTHLGGSDVDEKISNWIINEFKNDEGVDLTSDSMAMQRIKEASEKAKIELSSSVKTEINLPYITAVEGAPKHFVKELTRAKFESLIEDLVKRTIEPCKNALKSAKLSISDIDEVILVGGSSRIPCVQKAVEEFFGKAPSKGVNPDEVVSIGAAIQGAILNKESGVGDILLLDVTPLNLGIETMGNVLTTIVEANTTIPCKKTMTFSNASDNQPAASIMVYSGNRPMVYQNKALGQFNIELTPSPKGMNQIEVSFDIDANGILTVSAVDKALNKENKITIESSSSLTKEEIERMKQEAEANAESDKKQKEDVEKLNGADAFAFSIEKSLNEFGNKVSEDEKKSLNESLDKLKRAVSEKNVDEVSTLQKDVESKWNPIVEKMYASSNPNQGAQSSATSNPFNFTGSPFSGFNAGNSSTSNNDNVQDADFEEVK
jgi:molecular chaperone DnaK